MMNDRLSIILIDFQPVYTNNDNVLSNFPNLESNTKQLIETSRSKLIPENIIHVRTNYNSVFAKNFRYYHPNKPMPSDIDAITWAAAAQGEKIIVKNSFDGFLNSGLDLYLRRGGIKEILICGLLTSVCVLFTAQSAFALGYRVYVYEPSCADRDINHHNSIMNIYDGYIFKKIDNISDLLMEPV